ncbi:hypothetical protein PAMA_019161 [Pampus argenteus]
MQREELSAREEFTYSHVSTLERDGGTLGRRSDRGRPDRDRSERDSYTVDVRASDLQLAQPEHLKHPCFSYRAWLYSVLIGFPVAMDYLRCAAGSGLPAAIASFAIAKNRRVAVSDFQVVYVSTFAVTTTCLVWFGCKLVLNPSAVNINFNLILMILLEVLMASTVILSARSADDCCCHRKSVTYDRAVVMNPAVFPTRLLKAYSIEAQSDNLSHDLHLICNLLQCFPSAIASHVVSEYPNKCLVEVLIAISSVTSPLLFSASGFLSCSVISFIEIFMHDVPTAKMQNILDQNLDMATALLAGEKLKELILPGSSQDEKGGALASLMVQLKLELPFDRVVTIGTVIIPILLVTLVFTRNFAEESIYCYTPHNFTRDQALYARGYCWTELRDAVPGVEFHLWPSLFEHKFLPYALLAFAGIMYIPALGWEFLASTRLTSELNFLLQEIDNCYHRAAEGRAPKIEKQIQSKGPGITERERREIIENAEKEKSPEQNLFEKYLERRGQSNFLAKLYLARHLAIICLSSIPISYLSAYYARQRQNEFTCALGEPPDISSYVELKLRVNCKLPAVQLQRIMAAVDIALLCTMNLIILLNLLHLFVVRKSNFVFDKLHKVGIKTRRRWQKSQFCDINILAMFCNENRDHIKSLNRLDFITNESDLMYDNVVRQLLAALAQSNHDATPTVRDSGIQTIDPNMDPSDLGDMAMEPLVIKRPRKKIKWIPSSNPLPQPFKEPLTLTRLENNTKPEKPKPLRRKAVGDNFTPLVDSKGTQHPATKDFSGMEKKHTRNFSLDVHPYMLTIRKPKVETTITEPLPTEHNIDTVYLEGTHTIVHVSGAITETKVCSPESTNTAFSTVTLPTTTYVNGVSPNPLSSEDPLSPKPSPPPRDPLNQVENSEVQPPPLARAPTHQLLSIHHTLFEEEEDEEHRRDRLAERPGELIAAGEC